MDLRYIMQIIVTSLTMLMRAAGITLIAALALVALVLAEPSVSVYGAVVNRENLLISGVSVIV